MDRNTKNSNPERQTQDVEMSKFDPHDAYRDEDVAKYKLNNQTNLEVFDQANELVQAFR